MVWNPRALSFRAAVRFYAKAVIFPVLALGILITQPKQGQSQVPDSEKAVMAVSITFPMPLDISTLRASSAAQTCAAVLEWKQPGAFANSGVASSYIIKMSSNTNITSNAEFDTALPLSAFSTGTIPSPGAALTIASMTVQGLTANTTYYFAIRALNASASSNTWVHNPSNNINPNNFAYVPCGPSTIPPKKVLGLYGDISGSIFTIRWSTVTLDAQNNPEIVQGYNIYRSTANLFGPFNLMNGAYWTETSTAVLTNATPNYYKVTAVDLDGNESADSMVLDTNLKLSAVAGDQKSYVSMPHNYLSAAKNAIQKDLDITISNRTQEETGIIYRSVYLSVLDGAMNQPIKNFVLAAPEAEVVIYYAIQSGQVAYGAIAAGVADSNSPQAINAGDAAQWLSLYWHDGVKWVKIGSSIDPAGQKLTAMTSQAGAYQIRGVARADSFRVDASGQSHKIFTPNNDGWNDIVIFRTENPNKDTLKGYIYDITGALVAHMKPGPEQDSLMWDGNDDLGHAARSGIYIFQIEAGGKIFNGTVVVAR
ncbi:MAG: gliding motility-associated C-terminal domain-containing protein [Elusimicrobia bacterium]|nr:gliding motility-associated C-terminal domain-containing protein [Elusimicrobiota bacterium]